MKARRFIGCGLVLGFLFVLNATFVAAEDQWLSAGPPIADVESSRRQPQKPEHYVRGDLFL